MTLLGAVRQTTKQGSLSEGTNQVMATFSGRMLLVLVHFPSLITRGSHWWVSAEKTLDHTGSVSPAGVEKHFPALEKNDLSVFSDAALRSLGNHHQISGRN